MNLIEQLIHAIEAAGLWHKEKTLARNEYLTVKGNTDTNWYYVVNGSLRIYFEDEFEEQIIRLAYTNNLIAALDSFISDEPTNLYIQAINKCK